ncbi:MAG: adenylate cyclase [Chloroflexi bacterium]|nr:MAG: adenylate cyclase [Chloroflexota bacterium]
MCDRCDKYAEQHQGGAEVELSLLFADVRGSTTIAESMSPKDFSRLIDRFYNAASKVLIQTDALIDKIIGDQVAGMYVPGLVQQEHAKRAIQAAMDLLRATGHEDPAGPWVPMGAGVHTGVAWVGAVGSKEGSHDITVLGDTPNTAARLSSSAATGEILVSEPAAAAAELPTDGLEKRSLDLKGKTEPVSVYVLTLGAPIKAA